MILHKSNILWKSLFPNLREKNTVIFFACERKLISFLVFLMKAKVERVVYVEDLTDTVSSSTVAGVVKCTVTVSFNI